MFSSTKSITGDIASMANSHPLLSLLIHTVMSSRLPRAARMRDEEKFVQKIVEELQNMQNPQELHVTDYPIGIEPRVQELISNLRLDVKDATIVSVLGISGIGKSTIVKAMYNRIASKFDACCFLADVYHHCKSPNWKVQLQKELISCLTKRERFSIPSNHNDGVSNIKKLLIRRKVLLVLDDVDKFEQLKELGIHPPFSDGSRILVTTRDKQSLGHLRHTPYYIRLFSRRESLELFTKLTFEKNDPVDRKLVNEIVRCAGGLPLVLDVWSRHFKHHEREQWPNVLETLKRIPHDDIQKKLQISYDSLKKKGQKLFLDIACFFDGMYKDLVVMLLYNKDLAFFPEIELLQLTNKGLVKMGFGAQLLMLHAIREMGQEIVRQESEDEPGLRTRLRDRRDVIHVLTECSGTESVESIRLDFENKEEVTVQIEAFRNMSNLRLIQLLDPHLSWTSFNDDMPSFAFKKLKYLEWYGFPLKCINIDMGNVEVVRLENSKLQILWEGIKSLKKLRILDVNRSSSLAKTGSLYGLENLEELRLHLCGNLEELHNSIGCLDKLSILNLSYCTQLKRFPWEMIVKLRLLRDINLSHCPNIGLERDEVINPFMSSLKESPISRLQLAGCNILNISSEIGNLTSLKHLNLSENNFPSLPHSLSKLYELNTIDLSCCVNLLSIPDLPPNLTSLRARNCTSLINLPSTMSEIKKFRELWLTGCSKLGSEDPECLVKITTLRSLCDLCMKDCNVSQVPSEIGNMKSLQILELSGNTFSSLPITLSNLCRLNELRINDCSQLQILPLLPPNLNQIEASRCSLFDSMITTHHTTSMCSSNYGSGFNTELPKLYKKVPFTRRLCIYLTGNEVPNWCNYRARGHILSFVAPLHLNKKISGIIVCASIQINDPYLWEPSIKIVNKTMETSYRVTQAVDSHCTMLVMFFPLEDVTLVVEAGDIVVLKFLGKYAPKGILGCGLRLTYKGDVVDPNLVNENLIELTPPITSEMSTSITQFSDISSESDDDDVC